MQYRSIRCSHIAASSLLVALACNFAYAKHDAAATASNKSINLSDLPEILETQSASIASLKKQIASLEAQVSELNQKFANGSIGVGAGGNK